MLKVVVFSEKNTVASSISRDYTIYWRVRLSCMIFWILCFILAFSFAC